MNKKKKSTFQVITNIVVWVMLIVMIGAIVLSSFMALT
ncbi:MULTISPECIES: DUF4044 domain-containing protein [unclassified Enterococcus]|nr:MULTISPECIES: DUF4044 domain-containing protein [unclassified Enterococcus]MBS7577179.1 DUF4044 domain-containing protein [Enterococcus sp. MMGLQ5-2]MBS7584728.1 DUF4044 domain-containing protein [Enterococcus sp. MMGLQ5-1]NPD12583.1 DUF4044 domain-containing protein [Enterococcus sp. MMGLQ5-1]NPD37013.1 DUF4044 domain-containing protein [Enterococcus sp. MMGLQ5-2]